MLISTTLKKARKLITDPKKWVQRNYAADKYGDDVSPYDPHACAFCIIGAIRHVTGIAGSPVEAFMTGGVAIGFNDRATHDEVLMAMDFSILAAKDEEKKYGPL